MEDVELNIAHREAETQAELGTQSGLETEPLILVLDLPASMTAEESAEALNVHCSQGYYASSVVAWPGTGARVFLRRYAAPRPKAVTDVSPQTRETRAVQFMRDNREMSAKELAAGIKALGFPRSVAWVTKKRIEIVRADRRVS